MKLYKKLIYKNVQNIAFFPF